MGINLGAFLAPLICGYLGQQRQLARRVRRGRRRHDARRRSSTCSARKYLGDAGLHPAPAASPEARGAAARSARDLAARVLVAVVVIVGVGAYTGALPITGDAGRRRRRLLPADRDVGVLRLAVPGRRLDAGGAQAALRDRRAVPRRGAVLVGVRAGRLDAEPVRRSQHPHNVSSAGSFPSSWFQSLNSLFLIMLRAGVRVAVAAARHRGRSRRARPSSRSA